MEWSRRRQPRRMTTEMTAKRSTSCITWKSGEGAKVVAMPDTMGIAFCKPRRDYGDEDNGDCEGDGGATRKVTLSTTTNKGLIS
jgi:hypothetical protein